MSRLTAPLAAESAGDDVIVRLQRDAGIRTARLGLLLARWWAVVAFLVIGVLFSVNEPYTNSPPIRSDGLGYHAWTRALLDGNISFCPYVDLEPVAALEPVSEIGRCANKYPPGLALLRFPFMAPFTATNGGELRSPAEDRINQVAALAAGAVGMATAIAVSVRLKAARWVANFAALAVMLGTNQFHYATYDSSFTHIYTSGLVGVLTLLVVRADTDRRPLHTWEAILTAIVVAFIVDIRMMLVAPLVAVGLGLALLEVHSTSISRAWQRHRRLVIAATTGAAAALAQQLVYNRYIFGDWRISSYTGEEFIWSRLKQPDVLFSTHRGVFLWFPLVAVAIALGVFTRQKTIAVVLALAIGTLTVIYGAWGSWDLAGGFGHRGFVEVMPLVAVALAVGLSRVDTRIRIAGYVISALCVAFSLGLMRAYWSSELGFYGATTDEYVRFSAGSQSLFAHFARQLFG